MGHHYTPNAHLQRFGTKENSELIWMYDREADSFKQLPCKVAAQSPKYYPDDVEEKLADFIEGPGNKTIAKVINREELSHDDRFSLAAYMYVMRSRGPRQRRTNREIFPEIFAETMEKARAKVIEDFQSDAHELEKQLAHADRLQEEWKTCLPDGSPLGLSSGSPFLCESVGCKFKAAETSEGIKSS